MDWGIVGLIDVIIIVLGILVVIFGYKKGFMNKALSMLGAVVLFAFAIFYSAQLAGIFKSSGFMYNGIYSGMLEKITPNLNDSFSVTLEKSFGIPSFIAAILTFFMGNPKSGLTAEASAEIVATKTVVLISFFILFIAGIIVLIILHAITKSLREQQVIRVIDGIFGVFLYLTLYAVVILVAFFVLDLVYKNTAGQPFNDWLTVDLQLNDPTKFRISKYFFENNFLIQIKNAIFGS